MELSDHKTWVKESKNQMDVPGVPDVPKKVKKKKKKSSEQDNDDKLMKNDGYREKTLPNWLEMTDSEEEFMAPVKKKERKKKECGRVSESEENGVVVNNVFSPPKKSSKKKKNLSAPVELKQNGDLIDNVEDSDHQNEIKRSEEVEKSPRSKKTKKKEKSPKKNLFTEHDLLPSENGDAPRQESPKIITKASRKRDVDECDQSMKETNNKKRKKRDSETSDHRGESDLNEIDEEVEEPPKKLQKTTKKKINTENSGNSDKEHELSATTLNNRVNRVSNLPDVHEDGSENSSPEHVPKEPPKKPTRKRTKVAIEEQVTVGDEYKMKTSNERACKNCNENVKIKTKRAVRDMGTQTQESAVLNWIIGRTVKKNPARVRKTAPVSRKARIVLPKDDGDTFNHTNMKQIPISKELLSKLRDLTITLKHEPLPQHQLGAKNVCRPLSDKEKKQFENYAQLKTGFFDPEEDARIVKNWRKFCKKHDWDPNVSKPFTVLRFRGAYYLPKAEQRRKFIQFLAHGLPNRCLSSVQQRFKKLYSTHKTERYTPEEDQLIRDYIESRPEDKKNDFTDLAAKLNRTRISIWRRYKILKTEKEEMHD